MENESSTRGATPTALADRGRKTDNQVNIAGPRKLCEEIEKTDC